MKINFWEITLILIKKKAKISLFNFNLFFLNLPLHKEKLKVSSISKKSLNYYRYIKKKKKVLGMRRIVTKIWQVQLWKNLRDDFRQEKKLLNGKSNLSYNKSWISIWHLKLHINSFQKINGRRSTWLLEILL